jgi:molybdopterin synthase sulfur carrier subunit
MRVKIKLFGGPREALGTRELDWEIDAGMTAGQLLTDLVEGYPVLGNYTAVIRIAVNRRYADPGMELREGDEVACVPPVSGG